MDQICTNNQSIQPLTYVDAAVTSLTQAPVPEHALDPEVFFAQELHPTPDNFSLRGSKTHFLFSAIHDSEGQILTGKTGRFLVASTYVYFYMLGIQD